MCKDTLMSISASSDFAHYVMNHPKQGLCFCQLLILGHIVTWALFVVGVCTQSCFSHLTLICLVLVKQMKCHIIGQVEKGCLTAVKGFIKVTLWVRGRLKSKS